MTAADTGTETGLAVFGDFADRTAYDHAVERFRDNNIVLPTFAQLRDPSTIPAPTLASLADVDRNAPDARNLFRVHWFNALDGSGPLAVPDHLELPPELTGVDAASCSPSVTGSR